MNLVVLQGRLGKDPEVRYGQSGNAYASISVATSEKRKDQEGNWTEEVQWHRVMVFGKTAENVGQYLTKGSSVLIEGSIKYDQYQDKDGNTKYSTSIMARRVNFLDTKKAGGQPHEGAPAQGQQGFQNFQGGQQKANPQHGSRQGGFQGGGQQANRQYSPPGGPGGFDDDDIPF